MTKKARRRDIIIAVIGVLGLMLTTTNIASAQTPPVKSQAGHVSSHKNNQRLSVDGKSSYSQAHSHSFKKDRSESRNHKNKEGKVGKRQFRNHTKPLAE